MSSPESSKDRSGSVALFGRVVIPAVLTVGFGLLWFLSYRYTIHRNWTSGSVLRHLVFHNGRVDFLEMPGWWRVEPEQWTFEPATPTSITRWPGFDFESHSRVLHFEMGRGQYTSSFTPVTEDTEFVDPADRARWKPGTMLRVTRRFRLWGTHCGWIFTLCGLSPAITAAVAVNRRSSASTG